MNDSAFNQAEVTLFTRVVTYRDADGSEKQALEIKDYASVRYNESGQEGGIITPLTISWEGGTDVNNSGSGHRGIRFIIAPAPIEDGIEWQHSFGGV